MTPIVEEIELTSSSSDADWEKYCVVMRAMKDHYATMTVAEMRNFIDKPVPFGAKAHYAVFEHGGKAAVSFHKITGKGGIYHRFYHLGAIEFNDPQDVVDSVWSWSVDKLREANSKGFLMVVPGQYNIHIFQQAIEIFFADGDSKVDLVRGKRDSNIEKTKLRHDPIHGYKCMADFKGKGNV